MPGPLQVVSSSGTGTTLTTAITASQAGSCLVIYVSAFGDISSPTTVTITSGTGGTGGSFTADNWTAASTSLGSAGIDAGIWADPAAAAGTNAIKVVTNGAFTQTIMCIVEEWASLALTSVVDQAATPLRQSASSATWSVGPTGTTAQAAEVVLGCAAAFNATSASFTLGTPGAPWTEETQVAVTTGAFYQRLAAGYRIAAAAGTFTYNGTAAYKTTACLVTLKVASVTAGAAALSGSGGAGAGYTGTYASTYPAASAGLSGTGAFGGGAALSGSGTIRTPRTNWRVNPLAGAGTLTSTGTRTGGGYGTAPLAGSGTLTSGPAVIRRQAAALAGTGTITASQSGGKLTGTGTLTIPGYILGKHAVLSGTGTIAVLKVLGGLVSATAAATIPAAYPNSSQVAVAPPGTQNWTYLGQHGTITSLTYSFTCPGGADKLTCTLMVPAAYRTQAMNPGWQVRVTRGAHTVWTGRLDEPVPTPQGWAITAVGDGNRGADFLAIYTGTWPSGQPDNAVNAAITRGLPWNNPGVGTPAGAWYGQQADSGAQTITALLNLICTRGGLTWYVSSQPGGTPGTDLTVFPLPATVNRLLICTTPVARTLGGDINTVYVRYQSAADDTSTGTPAAYGITSAVNAQSVAAHGVIETFIDLSDAGVQTAGAAAAVASNVLAIYRRASFSGPFTASWGHLLNAGGVAIDPGTDQAGTVCRLILVDYGYGGEVTPQNPVTFIVGGYTWDDTAQVATIVPYQSLDQSLTGLLSAAHTALTPVTAAG